MKFAAIVISVLMSFTASVSTAAPMQEPRKNLSISRPSKAMILPLKKIDNPGKLRAFCAVDRHCSLQEYSIALGVCGLFVIKDGAVRVEMYTNTDKIRCDTEDNGIGKLFGVASVTKSITSTLLAQVLAKKYDLRSKSDFTDFLEKRQVGEFLMPSERKAIEQGYASVTLDHLLGMRSGVRWREHANWPFRSDSDRFDDRVRLPPRKETLLEFAAHYKLRRPETHKFNYSALDASIAMVVAASAVGGGHLLKAFETGIWSMIEAEHAASWNVDKEGRPIGSCCFRARIDDLARFGDFVLNKGKGKMPSAWFDLISAPTKESFDLEDEDDGSDDSCKLGYGYFWWLRKGRDDFTAYGRDGQFIHIYPNERTVIVQLSDWNLTEVPSQARCIALKTQDAIVQQLEK